MSTLGPSPAAHVAASGVQAQPQCVAEKSESTSLRPTLQGLAAHLVAQHPAKAAAGCPSGALWLQ